MTSLLTDVVEAQLGAFGAQGVDKVKDILHNLVAGSDDGWKKSVYTIVSDAVDAYGAVGVNKALQAIHDLLDGKTVDLDWADLEAVSNLLAKLENQEADERAATKTFFVQVGGVIVDIVTGIVMSL